MSDGAVVFPSLPAGRITWALDATANDSDKSFTVPTGHVYHLMRVQADIAASANAGNRVFEVVITDGVNTIYRSNVTASIAANQKGTLIAMVGWGDAPAAVSTQLQLDGSVPNTTMMCSLMNEMYLPAGYVIRVYDRAAIDAAADDLTVLLYYIDHTVSTP